VCGLEGGIGPHTIYKSVEFALQGFDLMEKPANFEARGALAGAGRKPKLKEAAQAALAGVELNEDEDCLVIAGGFDLKAKRCRA